MQFFPGSVHISGTDWTIPAQHVRRFLLRQSEAHCLKTWRSRILECSAPQLQTVAGGIFRFAVSYDSAHYRFVTRMSYIILSSDVWHSLPIRHSAPNSVQFRPMIVWPPRLKSLTTSSCLPGRSHLSCTPRAFRRTYVLITTVLGQPCYCGLTGWQRRLKASGHYRKQSYQRQLRTNNTRQLST